MAVKKKLFLLLPPLLLASAAAAGSAPKSPPQSSSPEPNPHRRDRRRQRWQRRQHHRRHHHHHQQQQQQQQQQQRELPPAGWQTWPSTAVSNLHIVHSLCDAPFVDALTFAADGYTALSSKVNLLVQSDDDGCEAVPDADLRYIDNKIHVVYGTCGEDCCGYTDVEYSYDHNDDVTNYSALVRIDPSCFDDNDDADGMLYIMCHELGHALGLGHNYDGDSCLGDYDDDHGNTPGWGDVQTLDYELYADAPDAMATVPEHVGGGAASGGYDGMMEQEEEDLAPEQPSYRPAGRVAVAVLAAMLLTFAVAFSAYLWFRHERERTGAGSTMMKTTTRAMAGESSRPSLDMASCVATTTPEMSPNSSPSSSASDARWFREEQHDGGAGFECVPMDDSWHENKWPTMHAKYSRS